MNQHAFETQNRPRWEEIDRLTQRLQKEDALEGAAALPSLYRRLCADIALAQHRMYGARLCTELNERLICVRQVLEKSDDRGGHGFARLMLRDFPRAVRREWRLFWLTMALLLLPMILMIIAAYLEPRWIFSVLGPDDMERLDSSFGKGEGLKGVRGQFDSDFAMFGFYVQNNISIGLRSAGAGLLAMVGALLVVAFNGIHIGAAEGYVHYAGDTEKFYSFVAGHSAPELLGIVICAVAGMRLGQAVLKPGRLTRGAALAAAGKLALPLIYGGALLIFFAAFIEGFWSAGPASPQTKYLVGAGIALILTLYLTLCGGREEHET